MRAAMIQNGQVISVIELPEGWPDVPRAWEPPPGVDVVPSDLADVGDTYEKGSFIRNFEAERDGKIYRVEVEVGKIDDERITSRISASKAKPIGDVVHRFNPENSRIAKLEAEIESLKSKMTTAVGVE